MWSSVIFSFFDVVKVDFQRLHGFVRRMRGSFFSSLFAVPSRILSRPRNRKQECAFSHSLEVVWDCRIKREESGERQIDLTLVGNMYSNASVDRLNRDFCICLMLGQ